MQREITEFDLFFLSYDEPNAEKHWADLMDKAPWAKRVHGVKGFEAAHRACAERSETDWFVTVDADNIVRDDFFNLRVQLDPERRPRQCFSWDGLNMMNGLVYGNGGVKLWSKQFVLEGGVGHEAAVDPRHAVDFCWNPDYEGVSGCHSEVWNNGSPYQAYRVGFREGVKLTLLGGERVAPQEMKSLPPINLRNIRIWCSVGNHVENGLWAMLGARQGWASMLDPDFDHTVVRDYDWFDEHWAGVQRDFKGSRFDDAMHLTAGLIERETGQKVVWMDAKSSSFFCDTFRWRNG